MDGSTAEFEILTPGFGSILAGGDRFRHSNELDNESDIIRLKGDFAVWRSYPDGLAGNVSPKRYATASCRFRRATSVFGSIADLAARDINNGFVLYGNSNTGVPTDAEAQISRSMSTASTFRTNGRQRAISLLTLGIRYDKLSNSDSITDNPNFLARRGYENGENLDGKSLRTAALWVYLEY